MGAAVGTVSVVLVTWNSAPFLRRCLEGVRQQTHHDLELIAVDNASGDGSPALTRAEWPDARQIVNDTNRGFTGAVNQGVAAARGEFVLLLNPDAFLEPDYLAKTIEALRAAGDDFGAATGRLMKGVGHDITPTDLVDSKGIRMTRTGRHLDIGQGLENGQDDRGLRPLRASATGKGQPASVFEVFGVSGAAALYRMTFLRDVAIDGQVLDEDFHTYREDADLAWRGRVLGWRALYVPDAVGYHVRTVTPQKRRELSPIVNMHSVKNRFLLRLKNESLYLALRNAPFELPRDLVAIAAVLTVERTSRPALTWIWKNRARVLARRREIQRRRRVSDRELAAWFR
ncbi:MAG: glycosyl transferase, family 2 [Acidobacteria bacterium]|nr:glycosyl transferase, family 2 [Acidobacteriota bacterium]